MEYGKKMNQDLCVEFWKVDNELSGSWAQMRKNLHYKKPDPKDVHRRFFSKHTDAIDFARSMHDQGYFIKTF